MVIRKNKTAAKNNYLNFGDPKLNSNSKIKHFDGIPYYLSFIDQQLLEY